MLQLSAINVDPSAASYVAKLSLAFDLLGSNGASTRYYPIARLGRWGIVHTLDSQFLWVG